VLAAYPVYLAVNYAVTRHLASWGERLADLERRGLLSKEFGAGWQDVLAGESMDRKARRITENDSTDTAGQVTVVDGIAVKDYPSLSIIDRLKEIRQYSNSIRILDRGGIPLAVIKTDHRRARKNKFPPTLITALIAAEDKNFMTNTLGFEFGSFVRAVGRAAINSLLRLKPQRMRGTSTITQQVAKLFISRLDATGHRLVSRSMHRKLRELRLAAAIRKLYGPDDILEVYLNHCVTSDYGLVGYKDIAAGLFGRELGQLTDAQCIYLARMVKWGRNVRPKITAQCRTDMPRMGAALGWDDAKQKQVLAQIDSLTFSRPKKVDAVYGSLVDLANEFWLQTLKKTGLPREEVASMDLIAPNSLIRKKGTLDITLTIDAPLQKALEALVNGRGYGPDTTILRERCVATQATSVTLAAPPRDTAPTPGILHEPIDVADPSSATVISLNAGDSVLVSVTYKKTAENRYRRTEKTFIRKPAVVNGQYFAYAIMDSRSGELLAYYSKDRLGSRLSCLLKNRTPNGSSLAKPVLNALCFDLGVFKPYSRWNDSVEVGDGVPWKRSLHYVRGKAVGVVFANSAVRNKGYTVHNHHNIFEGCNYVFDLLATSNNILGVETAYRLSRKLFDGSGDIAEDAFPLVQFSYRIGAFSRIKDSLRLKTVTGIRAYKELTRIVGMDVDSMTRAGNRALGSDSSYSVALGTLELSLYEQLHLFNALYHNDLIERPAGHPTLVLKSAVLNGDTVTLSDTIRRYHPFAETNNLRPTWLGLHKRLVANPADGLAGYDIQFSGSGANPAFSDAFDPEVLFLDEPASNYAKSGTSDDVITPFNAPPGSKARTNYGLWNAVIRIDLASLAGSGGEPDVRDVTVACVGECNQKYTGERDGKSLHKFLTAGLLKKAGIACADGFYKRYEAYLRKVTPADEDCGTGVATTPDFGAILDSRGD
ncbi:MAG: transglycosylase domain-containing protein, partial [Chitinispirillaceae bacterium]|nr:transglycosylase domain-containing protein [Chitinispirillaceae bacterium]